MGIEIEKKYRLKKEERVSLVERLRELDAVLVSLEFEENTIYTGGNLNPENSVLRLRRVGGRAIFTYKERFPSESSIKHQREEETCVEDADALAAILDALGYSPSLVYEKHRQTWHAGEVELVIDELPFGLFLEIEGEEQAITEAEALLNLTKAEAEMATYPQLAQQYGEKKGNMIEARFEKE